MICLKSAKMTNFNYDLFKAAKVNFQYIENVWYCVLIK